jgi:predicted MFS family arabinose efflux permease
MSATTAPPHEPPPTISGYANADEERRDYQRRSFVIALGWLATNFGLKIATLPLKFVLKEEVHLTAAVLSSFFVIGHFTNYVKPLAGVMTDSIPLCGTRRRHYLIFSLLSTGLFWILLSLVPRTYAWMLPIYTVMYIGVVFTSTTLGGVMVEAGNHFRAAGRFTAQRVAMFKVAEIIGSPIGGFLARLPFTVAATAGAVFHLALIPFLIRYLPKEPKATLDKSVWLEVKRQGRVLITSRTLLGAGAMIFLLAAAPGLNTPLFYYQRDVLHLPAEFIGFLEMVTAIAGFVVAGLYYPLCRRVNLRSLVAVSIVIHALGALCYLFYKTPQTAIVVSAINGATATLAMLPVYDIALRATPRGSEAIGYAVMMSMWNLTNALSDLTGSFIFEKLLSRNLTPLIWIDAATTLIVIVAVPFMPKALTTKESAPV